ncbi:hypothetical protein OWV82_019911 [Melia azedarach]|uniref:Uncharacterized protein n=1 Tax=Melia azedarach TaxID=155640 RepID=A0ACC1X6B5_MELAZ|nr:hypothetical protein OWV82_019911 [Melia azedarach]
MARGVSCGDDGGGDVVSGGGGSGGTAGEFRSVCVKRVSSSSFAESRKTYCSDHDTRTKASSSENDMSDVFFGVDDIEETSDLIYREDLLECYRRERALKSFRKVQKRSSSIIRCFEFLKLFCCASRSTR